MKQLIRISLVAFIVFSFAEANAQYYGNPMGLDRRIGGPGHTTASKKEDQPKFDYVQTSTDNLTKQLSLDTFQAAAVRNYIEDFKNTVTALDANGIPDEAKLEKMTSEKAKLDTKILSLLSKEQAVKFQEFKDKLDKKGSKDKKDKKKDKDTDSEEKQ